MALVLAFVDIFVDSSSSPDAVAGALSQLPNVEELYTTRGECDIVTLVSATDIEEFHEFLQNKVHKIKGVKSEITSIVLNADKGHLCRKDARAMISESMPQQPPVLSKARYQ
jgi:DNA-binding Lrp family transcriptional regulator